MDEYERDMLDIERAVTDYRLTELLQEARDTNELIADQIVTESEAEALVSALNFQWMKGGFNDTEFYLSGEAYIGGIFTTFETEETLQEDAKAFFPLRYPFTSEGFCLIQSTELTDEGFEVRQEIVARGRILVDDEDSTDGKSDEPCYIRLNDTNRLECDVITPGKAETWLATYHPDHYAELVDVIMRGKDEAEATLNLKTVQFPVEGKSLEDVQALWMNLEVFLNHALEYDSEIPYLAELFGSCAVMPVGGNELRPMEIMSEQASILLIRELSFGYDPSSQELTPFLRGMLRYQGQKRVYTPIHVPLTTLESLEAGRTIYKAWKRPVDNEL